MQLARPSKAGATIINTGIGWHEARVPTIATSVPRAAWTWLTKKLKPEVGIPVITSNRINVPEVAEQVLADGCADMVSMARPFLADPEFVNKAAGAAATRSMSVLAAIRPASTTSSRRKCRAAGQSRACNETELVYRPTPKRRKFAVVGAGAAGIAAATVLGERGRGPSVRGVRQGRRPAQHGGEHSGQGREFHEMLKVLPAQARSHRRQCAPQHRAEAATLVSRQLRRSVPRHRCNAA